MTVLAWHFVGDTLRDGRPIPADGEWLEHVGDAVMCESGLHASRRPAHALQYAPGATLCLVECADIVDEHNDKLVCRRRKIIARIDATEMLSYYARMQALSVVHLWDAPDSVLDYLMTGDESLRDAASAATSDAAWAAPWAAAWAAARDAAWAAARAAARDAAWAAAMDAAWAAAMDAAWAAAMDEFDALVYECFEGPLAGDRT